MGKAGSQFAGAAAHNDAKQAGRVSALASQWQPWEAVAARAPGGLDAAATRWRAGAACTRRDGETGDRRAAGSPAAADAAGSAAAGGG